MFNHAKRPIRRDGFLANFVLLCTVSIATAAPPTVIRAVPDNGQTDVDPALTRIVVEFDQDIVQGSHSWTGGGPNFPKITSPPVWTSARVCELPVQLQPNHEYFLSINNQNFKNFKNAQGEPAIPYPIAFKTRATGTAGTTLHRDAPKLARESFTQLREAIDQRYSYRDLRGVDWVEQFKDYEGELAAAYSPDAFARAAAKLLAPANDPHIWLVVNGITIGTMTREATANYSLTTLARIVPQWKKHGQVISSGRWKDGVGYVAIAGWNAAQASELAALDTILAEMSDTRGLIVDVRMNSGGDETLAEKFAARFVDQPRVYAKHAVRDHTQPGGFLPVYERKLAPATTGPRYGGKVAVLMGQVNMSSCETFLLMMRQAKNCKLIGEQSYGSSGNPKPVELANGVKVLLPSWKAMTADGEVFEGKGIAPDLEVKTDPRDLATRDPVLDAALGWLRE